jgi:hypothetical protein
MRRFDPPDELDVSGIQDPHSKAIDEDIANMDFNDAVDDAELGDLG